MQGVRVAIAGVGNRASFLIPGQAYDKDRDDAAFAGLMHHKIGDWGRGKGIARTDLGGGRLDV